VVSRETFLALVGLYVLSAVAGWCVVAVLLALWWR